MFSAITENWQNLALYTIACLSVGASVSGYLTYRMTAEIVKSTVAKVSFIPR